MNKSEVVLGYSLAIFEIARDEKKLLQIKKEALMIDEAIKNNPGYIKVLSSKRIHIEEKDKLTQKVFGKLDKNWAVFVHILVKHNYAFIIRYILEKIVSLINHDLNISEGVIYSTESLSEAQIKKISNKLKKEIGREPFLINKLDKSIISGIKILIEDRVYEDTIDSRLEALKEQILYGKDN